MISGLFTAMILAAFVEIFLNASWNRYYFRFGIPIYYRKIKCSTSMPTPQANELEMSLPADSWRPMQIRPLTKDRFAFRESNDYGFGRRRRKNHYTPLMHGYMRFDKEGQQIVVIGYLNWAVLLLTVIFVAVASYFAIFAFIIMGSIYMIQMNRFGKVGETASKVWSNFY